MRIPILAFAFLMGTQLLSFASAADDLAAGKKGQSARATVEESFGTIDRRDLLRITVTDLHGEHLITRRYVHVNDNGEMTLPDIKPQKVAGFTPVQAEDAIVKAYHDAHVTAVANVRRMEVGSRVKARKDKIENGDVIGISILDGGTNWGGYELRTRVGAEGEILIPYIGIFKVAGLSDARAEESLATDYSGRNIFTKPVISVHMIRSSADSSFKPTPLSKGDPISLTLWGLIADSVPSRLNQKIQSNGTIALPYIGSVKVEGLSEAKAAEAIAQKYHDRGWIRSAVLYLLREEPDREANVKFDSIASGDLLQIYVENLVTPTTILKVGDKGQLFLPFASDIGVDGLSPAQAERAIAQMYRETGLYDGPIRVRLMNLDAAKLISEEDFRLDGSLLPR
jgi:protein involved in polysaccharide export with SLBB domain